LLKLALHRLGGKGSNEIQRGSPAWWKCAWLIALLSGEFSNHIKRHGHEQQIQGLARADDPTQSCLRAKTRHWGAEEEPSTPLLKNAKDRSSCASYNDYERDQEQGSDFAPVLNELGQVLSRHCPCGNVFMCDSLFCRKCGAKRLVEDFESPTQSGSSPSPGRKHLRVTVGDDVAQSKGDDAGGKSDSGNDQELGSPISQKTPNSAKMERRYTEAAKTSRFLRKMESRLLSSHQQKAAEEEAWFQRSHADRMPRYIPPLDYLVLEKPGLFDYSTAEAVVPKAVGESYWPVPCEKCNEVPSPSGWGTPGCPSCSGVEELCLPISKHLFASLLRTPSMGIDRIREAPKEALEDEKDPEL
jgi:hypothetical protein